MTLVVLFLLAVGWAIYLASWMRSRASHRNVNSISSFSKHLSVLERTSPGRAGSAPASRWPADHAPVTALNAPLMYAPPRRTTMRVSDARRRRRDVLYVLVGAALVTLLAAISMGGIFIWLHLLVDVALASYVLLLVRVQQLAVERRNKVRYLAPPSVASADAGYYLQQSASAR